MLRGRAMMQKTEATVSDGEEEGQTWRERLVIIQVEKWKHKHSLLQRFPLTCIMWSCCSSSDNLRPPLHLWVCACALVCVCGCVSVCGLQGRHICHQFCAVSSPWIMEVFGSYKARLTRQSRDICMKLWDVCVHMYVHVCVKRQITSLSSHPHFSCCLSHCHHNLSCFYFSTERQSQRRFEWGLLAVVLWHCLHPRHITDHFILL